MADDPVSSTVSPLEGLARVRSYAGVQEVLRSADFEPATHLESREFVGDTVLTLHGRDHLSRRRLEAPLFTRQALAAYEHAVLSPVIERCLAEVAARRGADGVVRADLVVLSRAMLLQIAAAVVGLDGVEDMAAADRLMACLDGLIEATLVEWSTRPHDEVLAEGREWKRAFVEEFVGPSRTRRQAMVDRVEAGQLAGDDLPTDLITLMLRAWEPGWDADLLVREANLYLVAATLTTSTAVTYAVADLDRWFVAHPEDRARTADTDFLRGVAAEVLRLHVPSPAILRRATRDAVVDGVCPVGAGEVVAAELGPANRDAEAFGEDADAFDPHRSATARAYGHAFGGGAHVCIGRPLAMGTYASDTEGEVEGLMVRILKALYAADVRLDPEDPPERAASAHDRFSRFPVLLSV